MIRKPPVRREPVEPLRDRSHELQIHLAGAPRRPCGRPQVLPRDRLPAPGQVLADVRDRGAAQPRGHVVPPPVVRMPDDRACRSGPGEVGEVDAADEGGLIVDDHELFVVAVHRALVSNPGPP